MGYNMKIVIYWGEIFAGGGGAMSKFYTGQKGLPTIPPVGKTLLLVFFLWLSKYLKHL